MAVTKIYRPNGRALRRFNTRNEIFALFKPNVAISSA